MRLLLSVLFGGCLVVAASAISPSHNVTSTLPISPLAKGPVHGCPYAAAGFADGCSGRVPGIPQNPTLLLTYGPNRPPWNVAGVDYRVGHSGTLRDPSLGGLPACATYAFAAGQKTVTVNSSPCTIDHFNFSFQGGICLNVGNGTTAGQTVTITNNNLKSGTNCHPSGGGILNIGGPAPVIVRYNTLDANYDSTLSNIVNHLGKGPATFEYNVFLHPNQHTIAFAQSASAGGSTFTIRFNYNFGVGCCGGHGDWILIGARDFILYEQFNTVTIDPNATGSGVSATALCYMSTYAVTFLAGKCANDTYLSQKDILGVGHVSYVIRVEPSGTWAPGPFEIKDNYIDWIGSFGPIAGTSGGNVPAITCSGNKDIRTGAAITGRVGGFFTCN